MRRALPIPIALGACLLASPARAQNHEVIEQHLNAQQEGYTVVRVWGSRHEIGFAIGSLFADEIVETCDAARALAGGNYDYFRLAMGYATWVPTGVDAEFDGLVDGVKSVRPTANIDAVDMMVLNTYGDWAYPPACRSHSCWGSRTQAPFRTLSTRRLDFGSPFPSVHHHVLYAVTPQDEPVRWVNLAWPGFISVVTGVNEHGTLVSIHDFNSTVAAEPGVVSRSMEARHLLSSVPGSDTSQHLSWARQQLDAHLVATGTFINFFAPEGQGGVFTCVAGQGCSGPRTPQSDYLGGEVLITTNSQTDGHTTPYGAEYLNPYYQDSTPKTPENHFDVMVEDELHMLTVGYRGPGDMRLLAHGRTSEGWTPRIDVEWSSLFPSSTPDAGAPDGSVEAGMPEDGSSGPDADIDAPDHPIDSAAPNDAGAGGAASTPPKDDDDGCGCETTGSPARAPWMGLLLLGAIWRRWRR